MRRFGLILTAIISIIILAGLPTSAPAFPDIEVTPTTHDFGDIELGASSTAVIAVANIPIWTYASTGPLLVFDVLFQEGSSPAFSITSAVLPIILNAGEWAPIGIAYSPQGIGYSSAVLEIYSNDPDEFPIQVSLSGVGVNTETPPQERIVEILDFFDDSVDSGALVGNGPGKSAKNRLRALRNMIEKAGELIADGLIEEACQQLMDAYRKTDGQQPPASPPDFVMGPAASELAGMILDLVGSLAS